MNKVRLLAFSGSARKDSFNQRLVENAALMAEAAGAEVSVVNLADFPMPIMNQDLEATSGLPEKARELKRMFIQHDGLLIASPEYNSSISPLLKNALDWVSRAEGDEASLVAYKGKVAGLMSSSPGGLGGLRGLVHLRSILGNIGTIVLPEQVAIPNAFNAFDDDGRLIDENDVSRVGSLTKGLVDLASRLR